MIASLCQNDSSLLVHSKHSSIQHIFPQVCSMLTEHPEKPEYKKLAEFNTIVLQEANETCLDYSYDNMIKELRNITWGSEGGE